MVGRPVRKTVKNCGPVLSNQSPGWLVLTVVRPMGNPPAVGRADSTLVAMGPSFLPSP